MPPGVLPYLMIRGIERGEDIPVFSRRKGGAPILVSNKRNRFFVCHGNKKIPVIRAKKMNIFQRSRYALPAR